MSGTLIQSVQRAMRVIEVVAARDEPVAAKQIVRVTGLERATVYHLLRTLTHDGYLARTGYGYGVGPRLQMVASQPSLVAVGVRLRPLLCALSDATRCSAYLATVDADGLRLVDVVEHPEATPVELWVGLDDAPHATALGKALLAAMGRQRRADYLAGRPLVALTRRTITDRCELERSLPPHHPSLATDDGEYRDGVTCLAGAAVGGGGELLAIGLCGERRLLRGARPALARSLEQTELSAGIGA